MFISSRIAETFEANLFSVNTTQTFSSENYVFLLVQRGAFHILAQKQKYVLAKNDLILLYPGTEYTFQYLSNNQIFMFSCKNTFLDNYIPYGYRLECNSSIGKKDDFTRLYHVLEQLGILYTDETRRFAFISNLYALLDILFPDFLIPEKEKTENETAQYSQKRIETIRQYIDQHYHLPIYLQTLADEMFLSPQYLSKFIRQHMGITFNKYLNKVRMEHAYDELISTDHSIAEIAFNNGFSNVSAFNKLFRDVYELSPTAWRREHTSLPDASRKELLFSGTDDNETVSRSAPLSISYAKFTGYYPSWRDTINIGVLSNALSIFLHTALSSAQTELRFKYVRFNNIFDDNIVQYIPASDDFDFTNLDMIFDFFQSVGLLPFIEICYKPPKTSITPDTFRNTGDLFAQERPEREIIKALDALLRHCIYRYGHSEVSRWRFEIWAKHDELLHYLETPKEYWDKYTALYNVIKALVPDCAVGGPGYNTSGNIQTFHALMQEMKKRQIFPDFFSIYIYCYAPGEYVAKDAADLEDTFLSLSTNPDFPEQIFDIYQKEILKYTSEDIPLYVTEFNSGLYGSNYIAASAFQAAFLCRHSLGLFQKSPCIAYWYFSDISFDMTPDPHNYATGLGLIEQHGIPNPGFFAYVMMAKLKSRLAASGRNYIATTNGRNKYQFLIYHYVHYNNNFCFTYNTFLPIGNTYEAFADAESEQTLVYLKDIPVGRYKCTMYILNRSYGSVLDKFIHILNYGKTSPSELAYLLTNMQREEIEYYRKIAVPRIEISYLNNTSGTLSFDLHMEPHEIILINLEGWS